MQIKVVLTIVWTDYWKFHVNQYFDVYPFNYDVIYLPVFQL